MEKIKVGVIGTGFIGPAHIDALRRLGFVDVAALADINEETAKKKAKELSIEAAYGDYKDIISDDSIKVVHICTPNRLHYQMSKDALLAKKHVVCEKPLSLHIHEAEELIKLARELNLANAVHFNIRFYPAIHHIKDMIKSGQLGNIYTVNGSYQQDWLFFDTDYNWRLEPENSGESTTVADIGSHWFDLVEFMTGLKTTEVCADLAAFHATRKKPLSPKEAFSTKASDDYEVVEIKTEEYASVLIHFDNGAHGSCTVNQTAAGRKNRLYFEIYGSKASVAYDSERPNEIWIGHREKGNEILLKDPALMEPSAREIINYPGGHNEGFPDTSKQLFKKFYNYILGNKSTIEYPTFEDGLRAMNICGSIIQSAKSGKWISF